MHKMSLKLWLESKWLVEHQISAGEVHELLEREARPRGSGVSDWPRSITALLFDRVDALHDRACQDEIRIVDAFRKRRNISDYERAGVVSDTEAEELIGSETPSPRAIPDEAGCGLHPGECEADSAWHLRRT